MFRAPFLAPSSGQGGEQCIPEEGCSVAQGAAGLHCCSGSAKNDPMPWAACVQDYGYGSQCTHTCRFVACLSPQDLTVIDGMELVDQSDLRGDLDLSEEELRSSSTSLSRPRPS